MLNIKLGEMTQNLLRAREIAMNMQQVTNENNYTYIEFTIRPCPLTRVVRDFATIGRALIIQSSTNISVPLGLSLISIQPVYMKPSTAWLHISACCRTIIFFPLQLPIKNIAAWHDGQGKLFPIDNTLPTKSSTVFTVLIKALKTTIMCLQMKLNIYQANYKRLRIWYSVSAISHSLGRCWDKGSIVSEHLCYRKS